MKGGEGEAVDGYFGVAAGGEGSLTRIELAFERHKEVQTFYAAGLDVRRISAMLLSVELIGEEGTPPSGP